VRGEQDLGPVIQQVLQSGHGGTDTGIVSDVEVLVERHVEIGAHKHALALEVGLGQVAHGLLGSLHHEGLATNSAVGTDHHAAACHAGRDWGTNGLHGCSRLCESKGRGLAQQLLEMSAISWIEGTGIGHGLLFE